MNLTDFIKRLGRILEQTQTGCFAWALVPNHFHLLLRTGAARRGHHGFVAKGLAQGNRPDLTGGWTALKAMRKAKIHVKSDERILGDSDFVEQTLSRRK